MTGDLRKQSTPQQTGETDQSGSQQWARLIQCQARATSSHEMQELRKLVFGIDEEKTVQKKEIVDGIKRTSWLINPETGRAMDKVSDGWGKFPGIVPVLEKALGGNSAA